MIELDAEVKKDNQKVEEWLLWYEERKTEYLNAREAIIHSSGPSLHEVTGATTNISDPTGQKGAKLAELKKTEAWLRLIEEVQTRLPWKLEIFLLLRRKYRYRGRNGWVAAVQWEFAYEVAAQLGKKPEETWVASRGTLWLWWNQIVDFTARLAAKRGLLD